MDISTIDTSVPRARQLRDEPQSGRYPTRGYQQRQPSRERGAAGQMDLKHDEHGQSVLRTEPTTVRLGEVCLLDTKQPYQRLPLSRERRTRSSHDPDLPAARRLQRPVSQPLRTKKAWRLRFREDHAIGRSGCMARRFGQAFLNERECVFVPPP